MAPSSNVCEVCGFDFDLIDQTQIVSRAQAGAGNIVEAMSENYLIAGTRPRPERWSILEYTAHVRDVMLTIRDRLVIGLVDDNPGFKPMYRDERVDLGLYASDTPEAVTSELHAAAAMFCRLFEQIDSDDLLREVQFGYPGPTTRTLLWLAKQVVHETEHHLTDIEENVASLTT